MHYELSQTVIAPHRQTYRAVADRYGDQPATRYAEGTIGIQSTENFHYRPLWAPKRELYDERFSALRLADPDGFADPRQYYYAPYVHARAVLHDGFAKTLMYLEKRALLGRLPTGWHELLAQLVLPLRHYEAGAQLVSVAGARFAWGASVAQCLSIAAFDRIGIAQMLSRIGIALTGGTDEALIGAKRQWIEAPALQPLRRTTEELLVEYDWAVGLVGQDLVDQLVYPMLYRDLDEPALLHQAGAVSLLAQHFTAWYDDQRRWIDALYRAWTADPVHGAANQRVLAGIACTWLPKAKSAATRIAEATEGLLKVPVTEAVGQRAAAVENRFAEMTAEGSMA